jgi:gibberellin 2-oxidase
VRHRVVAQAGESVLSRLSMVYFGGPAPTEWIVPMPKLLRPLEPIFYRGFWWGEYKAAARRTKLAACRLEPFLLQ